MAFSPINMRKKAHAPNLNRLTREKGVRANLNQFNILPNLRKRRDGKLRSLPRYVTTVRLQTSEFARTVLYVREIHKIETIAKPAETQGRKAQESTAFLS